MGGADLELNLGYITDPEEFIMRTINKHLLQQNFENFGPFLLSSIGKVKDSNGYLVNLNGIELEGKMVEIEKTEVELFLPRTKSFFISKFGNQNKQCFAANNKVMSQWDCAIWGINRVSDGSCKTCYLNKTLVWLIKGFETDALELSVKDFKYSFPSELYNFLNIEHRVYIGKRMAYYLRK